MSQPSAPDGTPSRERRNSLRVTFSPVQRPRLHLQDRSLEVLDASLTGLRLRHADPDRPLVGAHLSGRLEWPDAGTSVPLRGTIVRVQPTEMGLAYDEGSVPLGYLLSESARRRDRGDDAPGDLDDPRAPEQL